LKTKATLQSLGHTQFDGYFVSPYIRTLETALHLGFEGVDWTPHRMLRERDDWLYGLHTEQELEERFGVDRKHFVLDPIYWRTTQGESMADIELRLRLFFEEIAATSTVENVIVVAHSRVMWTLRMWFEHLSEEQIVARSDKSDGFSITNGHILQYRRSDGSAVYDQVRSIDPRERKIGDEEWTEIVPKRFSSQDLAKQIEAFPRLFE
jgi:broad specificity phosphatase PhoE